MSCFKATSSLQKVAIENQVNFTSVCKPGSKSLPVSGDMIKLTVRKGNGRGFSADDRGLPANSGEDFANCLFDCRSEDDFGVETDNCAIVAFVKLPENRAIDVIP